MVKTKGKQVSGFVSALTQFKWWHLLWLKGQIFDFCFGQSEKKYSSTRHGRESLINQALILWFNWMTSQNLIHWRNTLPTDVDQRIWLADQSKSSKSIQNDLWLVCRSRIFVPVGFLYKIDILRAIWEKWCQYQRREDKKRNLSKN